MLSSAKEKVAEAVAYSTVVPALNSIGLGISSVDINVSIGCAEVFVDEGHWIANTLKSFYDVGRNGAGGFTPTGNMVIIRDLLHTQQQLTRTQTHEGVHIIQHQELGVAFYPIYFLGNALYGYRNNPLEVQARKYETP